MLDELLKGLGGGGLGGLDLTKMMSDPNGLGASIMPMLMSQLNSPEAQKMINDKLVEMGDYLATAQKTTRDQVGLFVKFEKLPAKNEKGDLLLDAEGKQILEDKAYAYIYVGNEAKEKIAVQDFMKLVMQQQQEVKH